MKLYNSLISKKDDINFYIGYDVNLINTNQKFKIDYIEMYEDEKFLIGLKNFEYALLSPHLFELCNN